VPRFSHKSRALFKENAKYAMLFKMKIALPELL